MTKLLNWIELNWTAQVFVLANECTYRRKTGERTPKGYYISTVCVTGLVSSHCVPGSGNSHIQLSPNRMTVIKYESHTYDMTSLIYIYRCVCMSKTYRLL